MMKTQFFLLFAGFPTTTTTNCPSTHPWAYLDGDFCCATNREKVASEDGLLCDGSIIELTSSCCENSAYTACASPPCANKIDGKNQCSEKTSYANHHIKITCLISDMHMHTLNPMNMNLHTRTVPALKALRINYTEDCIFLINLIFF